MKTTKWLILSLSLLFILNINAQNNSKNVRITMQFEGETNVKTYDCSGISSYFNKTVGDDKTTSYDIYINCLGIPDQKQLEWFTDSKLKKTIKITVFKFGKKEREYILKNTSVVIFTESAYAGNFTDGSLTYDISLLADQIFIDGIQAKGTN